MYTFKIYALYQVQQPIIHTEETIGNISKIKKLRVLYEGKPVTLPALSGNSFRGQFRDILADQMFAVLTENGTSKVTIPSDPYGVIYSGGIMNPKSRLGQDMKEMADAIPLLRLMGSAFGNVMLPSKLAATHILPYAVETQDVLAATIAGLSDQQRQYLSAQPPRRGNLLFNDGPLTRKDDTKDLTKQRYAETETALSVDDEPSRQMIYYVECIPPGTLLLQELYSKYDLDDLELGCLFDGLLAFLRQPSLGVRSAAGYGQVAVIYHVNLDGKTFTLRSHPQASPPDSVRKATTCYNNYLRKDEVRTTILCTLGAKKMAQE